MAEPNNLSGDTQTPMSLDSSHKGLIEETILTSSLTNYGTESPLDNEEELLALSQNIANDVITWVGGSGYWDEPSNWSTGILPGTEDEVIIDVVGDIEITYRQNSTTVKNLTVREDLTISGGSLNITGQGAIENDFILSGGTLSSEGTFNITGDNNQWRGGTIAGVGDINIDSLATLTIDGTGTKHLGRDANLNNAGTIIWKDGTIDGDSRTNNDVINNTGLFDIQTEDDIEYGQYLTLNNSGTLRKSVGTAETQFYQGTFNNTGDIEVETGRLSFSGSGDGEISGGTITTSQDAVIEWNGDYNFSGDVTTSGDGVFEVSGRTINATGNATIHNLHLTGGTLTADELGTFNITGDNNQWTGGTIAGVGDINIDSLATLTIDETGTKHLGRDANLNNAGTIIWKDGTIDGDFRTNNDVINNTGLFDIQTEDDIEYGQYLTLNNSGTLRKSVGTAETQFYQGTFNNTGDIEVETGRLSFSGSGDGEISGGTITTSQDAVIEWDGDYNFSGDVTTSGEGVFEVSGRTINATGNATIHNLHLTGGTLTADELGTFNITGDNNQWRGGTIAGVGDINVTAHRNKQVLLKTIEANVLSI